MVAIIVHVRDREGGGVRAGADVVGDPHVVEWAVVGLRKGTNGVSTNGVTANFMFLAEGLAGYQSIKV